MAEKTPDTRFLKVAFRKAVLEYEVVRDYKTEDVNILCSVEYVEDRYVYVFITDPEEPSKYKFFQEYYGLGQGAFAICASGDFGKDKRGSNAYSPKHIWIPGMVGDRELEIYACLSHIQLPWSRVEQIAKAPSRRCYRLGTKRGGLCWLPKGVERIMQSIAGAGDQRLVDPGDGTLLVGLYDHIDEARSRSKQFEAKLDAYLQARFDTDERWSSDDTKDRLRMLKYTAGLIHQLANGQHKHAGKFRAALAQGGRKLEDTLRTIRERELRVRQEAEQAAYSVVRWIDDRDGVFEQVLADYTATDHDQDKWDWVQDEYCSFLNRFHEMSVTRRYLHAKWEDSESWLNTCLLNANAFQGVRKATEATVKFLDAASAIAPRFQDMTQVVEAYEKIYGVWFRGIRFEKIAKDPFQNAEVRFPSLVRTSDELSVTQIRVSPRARPLEALGTFADSKVVKGVSVAIEGINMALSMSQLGGDLFGNEMKMSSALETVGAGLDLALAVNELTRLMGTRQTYCLGMLSGTIDSVLAVSEGIAEWDDKDYDAALARASVALGAVVGSVGNGLLLASTFGSLAAGAVATGGALIVVGVVVAACGSIAYILSNDSAVETFIKETEWGVNPQWSFVLAPDFDRKVEEINRHLMDFHATVSFDPFRSIASIRIQTRHLRCCSAVRVISLKLHSGNGGTESVVDAPRILSENGSNGPTSVSVTKKNGFDVLCLFKHSTALAHVNEVSAAVQLDITGNGSVVLPTRAEARKLEAKVFWG